MRKKLAIIFTLMFLTFVGCQKENKSPQTAEEQSVEIPKLDLHAAIYMRDLDAVRQHIKVGTDINTYEPTRKSTPLITAAVLGESEAAQILIDAGADLDYKNLDGSTAIQAAAVFGKSKVAKVLIDAGADLNITNYEGSTVLHTAAFFCRKEIVKALLQSGVDKTIKNNNGKTAYQVVEIPFEDVKDIYDAIGNGLKPLGVELDYDHIKISRPIIAEMLNK